MYDVAVVGLGAMGSAVAYASAGAGARVIGFDRLNPPHTLGSSHGRTRIIREAYYEHPLYVPLVRRSYELWEDLARHGDTTLFQQTGGLMVGKESGALFGGALQSARTHDVAHEVLDANELNRRFPAYRAPRSTVAVFEQRAGMLYPERCVQAHIEGAIRRGVELRLEEPVLSWKTSSAGVTITTPRGTVDAARIVVAAGAWLPQLAAAAGLSVPLEVERQMSHWFEPDDHDRSKFAADRCPVALWEMPDGDVFATLPDEGNGVKCGMHHAGAPTTPEAVNRSVSQGENAVARELLETVMPGAGGRLLEARVCLYTNTPDHHFIIDWTDNQRVLIVSACSGHGFKFASAIGELAAQLLSAGTPWLDLRPFSMARF